MHENVITDIDEIHEILRTHTRVAVLGIKPESRAEAAAFRVPKYLKEHGYDITPVPVYYPEVTEILGRPVVRDLTEIEGEIDVLDVFRKPSDIDAHLDDMLALAPKVVWFQQGIRNDAAAERLAEAGIRVVQDKCMLAEHKLLG